MFCCFGNLVLDPAAIRACVFQYHGAQQCSQGLHNKFFLSHKHDFSVTRSMTLMQKENASLFVYTNLSFAIF